MATEEHSAQFGAVNPGVYRHVCAFFSSMDEEYRVLGWFYRDGFERGVKATHIVDAENRELYLKRLAEAGLDVERVMDNGQLEVLPWTDMYVRDHRFDQDAMLASVEALLQSGASAGYSQTKLVGHHIDWVFADKPAVNNLLEYEARLNTLLSKYTAPVICNYDLSKVSARVAVDIIRTHPVVIIGGLMRENPFFVPPDKVLEEMRNRRAGRQAGTS
jgi:hypothetical protein